MDWSGAQIDGKRDYQEDAFDIFVLEGKETGLLCILADGMGGHAAGDIAAQLAVREFAAEITISDGEPHHNFLMAIDQANRAIAKYATENPKSAGMGCTLVGLQITDNLAWWVSVGDSPLFHVSNGRTVRVNADHSMAPRLDKAAERGEISLEEAQNSPSRNALLSALTGETVSRVDAPQRPLVLQSGDWLLLCSDGVETLSKDQISHLMKEANKKSADEVIHKLLKSIKDADKPGQDNATIIAIGPFDGQPPAEKAQTNTSHNDTVTTRPISARSR